MTRRIDWWRLAGLVATISVVVWIAPNDVSQWKMWTTYFLIGFCYPSVFPRRAERRRQLERLR